MREITPEMKLIHLEKPGNLMERNQICGIEQQSGKQDSCETKCDFQKFYLSVSIKSIYCHNRFKYGLVLLASENMLIRGILLNKPYMESGASHGRKQV